jgi:hypothetical protein
LNFPHFFVYIGHLNDNFFLSFKDLKFEKNFESAKSGKCKIFENIKNVVIVQIPHTSHIRQMLLQILAIIKGLHNRPAQNESVILIDISDYNSIRFGSNLNADY